MAGQPVIDPSKIQAYGAQPAAPAAPSWVPPRIDPNKIQTYKPPKPTIGAIPRVVELLNRGSEAGTASVARGIPAGFQTMLHSESQQQYESDTEKLSRQMQGMSEKEYAQRMKDHPWEQGANNLATQILMDPTTYIGGLGIERRLIEAGGEHLLPAVIRAMEKLGTDPAVHSSIRDTAQMVSKASSKAHDYMMGGGHAAAHAQRKLAYEEGRAGVQKWQKLYSLRGAGDAMGNTLTNTLNNAYRVPTKNLDDGEKMRVFDAIYRGTYDKLPSELQTAAKQLVTYQQGVKYLLGNKYVRSNLAKEGFTELPEDLKRFENLLEGKTLDARTQYAKRHIPIPEEWSEKDAKDLVTRHGPSAGLVEDMFKSSFTRAGEQYGEHTTARRAADVLGVKDLPQYAADMFKKDTAAVDPLLKDIAKKADIAKATQFWSPLGHMSRIATLLAAHSPTALVRAGVKYAKMGAGFGKEEDIAKALGSAVEHGATGVRNIEQSNLEESLGKLGPVGQAIGKYYHGVGKMLWGWDEAAKSALFDEYAKMYKDPLTAAYHVQQDLVNYGAQSPFIKGAGRLMSTFPTWRTRMPVAFARAVAKHPQIAANLARMAPQLYGQEFELGGKKKKFYGSALSEGAGAFGLEQGPMDALSYLRSSIRPGWRSLAALPLAAIGAMDPKKGRLASELSKFATAGAPAAQFAAYQSVPYLGTIMSLLGKGMYSEDPSSAAMFNILNIGDVASGGPMKPPRPPMPPKPPKPGHKKSYTWWQGLK